MSICAAGTAHHLAKFRPTVSDLIYFFYPIVTYVAFVREIRYFWSFIQDQDFVSINLWFNLLTKTMCEFCSFILLEFVSKENLIKV
jgi:hypothetical protein